MPSPNDKTKMTGDTHLPETDSESEFNTEEANPQGAGENRDRQMKDQGAAGGKSERKTRDSER